MVKHDQQKFADEIANVFVEMPVPDKYNDHDLSVKVVSVSDKNEASSSDVNNFLQSNYIGSRLISKWFDRDATNGACTLDVITNRGLYNASEMDKAVARESVKGNAMLEDAGLDLISNTFVLVNDISYIDRAQGSKVVGSVFKMLGAAAAAATNNRNYADLGDLTGAIAESYKGFKVKIYSHLYQLVWDAETEETFYDKIYTSEPDAEKQSAMALYKDKFKLKYIGSQISDGSNTSFLGINEDQPELMVRKACQRALDNNVANLQKHYEVFKVKVPLTGVEPLTAEIGLKEGIDVDSKFEVLEIVEKDGKTDYKRVGVIKPDKDLIWDNRFMAVEEKAKNATLGATTFKKVSGGDFYPGMLIREIK